jgi:hypothetical protein
MTFMRPLASLLLVVMLLCGRAWAQHDEHPVPPPTPSMQDRTARVQSWAQEQGARLDEAMEGLKNRLAEAKDEAKPVFDRVEERLGAAKDRVQEKAPELEEGAATLWAKVKQVAAATVDAVEAAVERFRERMSEPSGG